MIFKDDALLEEAYMSVSKPVPSVPSDEEEVSLQASDTVDTSPVTEPAPGAEMPSTVHSEPPQGEVHMVGTTSGSEDSRLSSEDESEEDSMAIDNLASIRDSIMKTAAHCASGGHLEPWQQQKLAIAMDNLAAVARSLRSGSHC